MEISPVCHTHRDIVLVIEAERERYTLRGSKARNILLPIVLERPPLR